ncbi:60S ribosomal protein L35a [Hyalella azteca]|uniref:Large ribosomal subunit protein eL33 n=1 Tax=Hyalella azteca TaxID=294128 RepID=A0A8B7P4W8_HYAAZ|nr:60S ribosomal protein L35a [Hyalella azteca]
MTLIDLHVGKLNRFQKKVALKVREARRTTYVNRCKKGKSRRLHALAVMSGYRRGQRRQHEQTAILHVEGSRTKNDAAFYVGKKCAFVYKGQRKTGKDAKKTRPFRAIWGKVTRLHGNAGSVRAKFSTNLPPAAIGKRVRIMLYPSKI